MANDELKNAAAQKAVEVVESGMAVGLGSGSTAEWFVRALGARVSDGLSVRCIATSQRTQELALSMGIPMSDFSAIDRLDVTVDGADEIDPDFNLIKGGGGAHLREKIVASNSDRLVIVADETKLVSVLGAFPLPVEIVRFGAEATRRQVIDALIRNGQAEAPVTCWRETKADDIFHTDSGNLILDCACKTISDPYALAAALSVIPGVVEHGLFIDMADEAIVAGSDGIKTLRKSGNE